MDAQRRKAYAKYRSSYRRVPEQEENKDLRETILMQCTVSGIILILVLVICLINLPVTKSLRTGLKQAISETTTAENIVEIMSDIYAQTAGVKNNIRDLFGEPADSRDNTLPIEPNTINVSESPMPTVKPETEANDSEVRVDEDILLQLQQNDMDISGKKQSTPPE